MKASTFIAAAVCAFLIERCAPAEARERLPRATERSTYVQQWATETVWAYDAAYGFCPRCGSYDVCYKLQKNSPPGVHGLSDQYPPALQNACAIVLYGAEY